MRATLFILPLFLSLVACNIDPSGGASRETQKKFTPPPSLPAPAADPFTAHDPASGSAVDPALADDEPRSLMQLQVVLDRLGFTPVLKSEAAFASHDDLLEQILQMCRAHFPDHSPFSDDPTIGV
ncbi:hypothetical protein KRR38_12790 [Novosphingobium sp. G106]|uniref:hypothetical protein n=1 Tax=Novosphingobium sp. G106 TaxID=2849500 RepID=UPI001C2D2ECA|nr:hypothetical protein [Novosphingobium sp. G106]MBV1688527.1 hypothetical protein [Novosphingobium sp. G106]